MWLRSWRDKMETPFNSKRPKKPICALGVHFSYYTEHANKLNFEEKILSLEKTLNCWRRRNLTLLGRINIVKTLGLSKLIYNTSVLTIPEHFVKEINKLTFNFIWEDKRAKIKKTTIIRERQQGGLKMIDFEIMEKALKLAWIGRLKTHDDASWKAIPEFCTSQYGGISFLIDCQYDFKSLYLENLPDFYCTVLNYRQDFNNPMPHNENTSIDAEIIWNNRNIKIDGKPIFYNSWFRKGIIRLRDLLNENHNFLSLVELKEKFNFVTPFTTYYGLIKAIKAKWKKLNNTSVNCNTDSAATSSSSRTTLTTRAAYSSLLNKVTVSPTCENGILNSGFTRDNIHDVYLLPFTVTKQTKLIAFQYKIIHNVLPNQVSLFHAGITENATCPLCSCEKQTTAHMLFNCTKSTAFWNSIVKWWHQKFNQIVDLNECIILYGWHKNTPYNYLLNCALLVAKYHIFATSICNGGGRKGGPKTAKPHRKTYKNRNTTSNFTKIPKPQLQMWSCPLIDT